MVGHIRLAGAVAFSAEIRTFHAQTRLIERKAGHGASRGRHVRPGGQTGRAGHCRTLREERRAATQTLSALIFRDFHRLRLIIGGPAGHFPDTGDHLLYSGPMTKTDGRLPPTPGTIKKLFAWSGNQCAMPDCRNELVDDGGTMLGKIAHIHAANAGGARFDAALDEEQRRAFANLFLVCGPHHDIIDDPHREAAFPPELLRDYKRRHESRFQRAEHEFLERYKDRTRDATPSYPVTLDALADALKVDELRNCPDDIQGIADFIGKLARLPRATRTFAIELAARMRDHGSNQLPVDDVEEAFEITSAELKKQLEILDHHQLGCADDHFGRWVARLYERDPGSNPFIEILEFCEVTGCEREELLFELNFALYDTRP
ncbi:hypothetical protein I5L01_04445 [Erythrobacter sp. YJ-T3-07]|uniref:hypothetical protein n=1 Tax=Erythrobacter sp. YJ-T3-07 TaxID=2793063 RepID=UPI0018D377D6|nr:hypothetical protein [Erythrobacter sp. YJ-T3-07]MBH1943478.1 hypothetical protein [Erythrobacter sp. YJ-T3-07]